jgi:malate dehydrogenase (oxaloacetate-decarboxylating)(NADP+)
MQDADAFIGVSGPDLVSPEMLKTMAPRPVVFALSNPDPEIAYDVAIATRDDLVMATGRSDFPNQVNNVLGFPFIFRGALDVRAKIINDEMKIAAVHALALLAREPVTEEVLKAYNLPALQFGKDYIIPKPFDTRLMQYVPPAIAQAAIDSGAAGASYPHHYPPAPTV